MLLLGFLQKGQNSIDNITVHFFVKKKVPLLLKVATGNPNTEETRSMAALIVLTEFLWKGSKNSTAKILLDMDSMVASWPG